MSTRYEHLNWKYQYVLADSKNDYLLFLDGKKKKINDNISPNFYIDYLKSTDEYFAILQIEEINEINILQFALADKNNSNSFLSYILDFITSNNDCFYKIIDGIIINDYHPELFNVKDIRIDNAIIDNKMLELYKKYFPSLKRISFSNCVIKEDSNFSYLNCSLLFQNCEIENIHSFNYCKQDIMIKDSDILKITKSTINSHSIRLVKVDEALLKQLFLICHFPELEELEIINVTIGDCLTFMPYACPDLMRLYIEGEIATYDFMYHLHNLSNIEIFDPIDNLENIIRHLKIINISSEEKKLYLDRKREEFLLNPSKNFDNKKINRYYTYDYNDNALILHADEISDINMINDYLYFSQYEFEGKYVKTKKNLIKTKKFIYHSTGVPIIFNKNNNS